MTSIKTHDPVLRIEISPAHRRRLGDMARESKVSAHELASKLLAELIDDDAAAHGEKVEHAE